MHAYKPDVQFTHMAIEAAKILQTDFAGVDILFGDDESPILCEVNSNAHIKNISECTSIDIAGHIIDHILETL